jgi:hypothetical protein
MENPGTNKTESADARDAKTPEDRLAEATSEKIVSDLEKDQEIADSDYQKSSDERSVPSPDGAQTPERSDERADGSDIGGPM